MGADYGSSRQPWEEACFPNTSRTVLLPAYESIPFGEKDIATLKLPFPSEVKLHMQKGIVL